MSCHFHRTTQRPHHLPGLASASPLWCSEPEPHHNGSASRNERFGRWGWFCCKDFFFTPKFNIFAPGPKNGLKLHLPSQKMKIKQSYRSYEFHWSSISKFGMVNFQGANLFNFLKSGKFRNWKLSKPLGAFDFSPWDGCQQVEQVELW